jgi:hypothetical protein
MNPPAFFREYATATIIFVVALTLTAAVGLSLRKTYQAGFDAGKAESDLVLAKAERDAAIERAAHQEQIITAERALVEQAADAARRLAAWQARTKAAQLKLEEAINANPNFAAVERPADLRRVRSDDFAELVEAARRGAGLSSGGLPGVPGAGGRAGADDGRGGASRP